MASPHKAQIKPWTLAKLKAREHMLSTTVLQSLKSHPTLLHSPGQEKEGKAFSSPDSVPPHTHELIHGTSKLLVKQINSRESVEEKVIKENLSSDKI